jgi:UDP-N-acetylglucosamine--N-acetylmuramyl-(pentapeptide) pyrophosphoryl-undecaprenol N-acetylglucosamine transferase
MSAKQPFVLAAGGTGGHLFPALSLAAALVERGEPVMLATDERVQQHGADFPADAVFVIRSATFKSRTPWALAQTVWRLLAGFVQSFVLLRRLRPRAVIGFGGYPSIPPLVAALMLGFPTVIHEQNGVLGRANAFLARFVRGIGTGLAEVKGIDEGLRAKSRHVGNPLRPKVLAAITPYTPPVADGTLRLLVTGGSLGARIMSDVVPQAVALLDADLRQRLHVVQQARPEDLDRCRALYEHAGVKVELASFFDDLPSRIAWAHLVIGRAGASTVAELAALGRPSLLVPLPHALDQDQAANAAFLAQAGAADVIAQRDFTPQWLAAFLGARLTDGLALSHAASAAKALGKTDAAEQFAAFVLDLVATERA